MVGLSGKEMWQKIEGLGPMTKRHRNLDTLDTSVLYNPVDYKEVRLAVMQSKKWKSSISR